jgi:hypothetical protein
MAGRPDGNATLSEVAKWLLINLPLEPVVVELAQGLSVDWEEKYKEGKTGALVDAVKKVVDALEALSSQEPGTGGGGEQLPKETGAASGMKAHAPCPKPSCTLVPQTTYPSLA